MRYHDNVVPNPKVYRVRTDEGWIKYEPNGPYMDPVAALLEDVPF
jgi:hypothetical protein